MSRDTVENYDNRQKYYPERARQIMSTDNRNSRFPAQHTAGKLTRLERRRFRNETQFLILDLILNLVATGEYD